MVRAVFVGMAALLLLASAAQARHGDTVLDKKDSFDAKSSGYQPGTGVDKLADPIAPKFFQFITGHPHKVYNVKLKKGDKVVISMKSTDMDSVVIVENSKKAVLAFNDDDPAGGTLDSRLEFTAPADDEYRVIATNLDKKNGNFQLTVTKAK
jgi:hypothetical protein